MDGQNEEKNRTEPISFLMFVKPIQANEREWIPFCLCTHSQTILEWRFVCVCVSLGMDFVVPIQMQCLNIDQIKANTLRNRIVCLSFPVWLNRHSYLTVASPSFTFAQRHSTLTTLHLDCVDYGYMDLYIYIFIFHTQFYILIVCLHSLILCNIAGSLCIQPISKSKTNT